MPAISVGRMLRGRPQAAKRRGHRVRDHVANRFVGLAFSDFVSLRESFAAYGYVSHKPQGLKPLVSLRLDGTATAVPFHKSLPGVPETLPCASQNSCAVNERRSH